MQAPRQAAGRQTGSFRDLVFDTTSPFLFPCRCEGGTDAAQVESGTQESRIVPPERVKTKLSSHFESLSSFFEKYEKIQNKISE